MNTRRRHTLNLLRGVVALLFASAFLSRCASMMTPTGGPIDSLPPVIVNMIPDNFSTNRPTVNHGKIYIEFDEFIQIKDQQKEFFTSPQMKKKPLVSLRGRGVVIQLRDTLEANTTYALNFGSAIRDNNEGNPLYSMRYVFSTGPEIDSMVMSGYTADSYKADSVSKSFIWFFPADSVENVAEYDSTIFKYKPAVIARAENNGIFIAQNLKPIAYRVYAVQDKNDNQIYEPGSDQVGFLEGTYNPREQPDFAMWYDSIRQYVVAEPQLYLACLPTGRSGARCFRSPNVPCNTRRCSISPPHTRRSSGSASTASPRIGSSSTRRPSGATPSPCGSTCLRRHFPIRSRARSPISSTIRSMSCNRSPSP